MNMANELNNASNDPVIPKEWQPYSEQVGDQVGSAIVKLPRPTATEHDLLVGAGFDPDSWHINGPINTRKWMAYHGDWLYYYKFDVVAGESRAAKKADVDEIAEWIKSKKPVSANASTDSDCFAFFMSDLQIGKISAGITSQDIVNWYTDCVDQSVQQVKNLRAAGHAMPHGAIIGLGDIVENCFGHYANQQFLIDLNQRDQNKTARLLLAYTINAFLPLFDKLTVAAIGGNHGERRDQGKKLTDDADNMDLEVFDAVKEAYDLAGVDLDWQIAGENLSQALELGGTKLGITHGHTFRAGVNSAAKAEKWMKDQIWGLQEVRDCTVLVHGHFHHLSVLQSGQRHLIQAPALDAGSKWFVDTSGQESAPGVLTMRLDGTHGFGYDDLKVVTPKR